MSSSKTTTMDTLNNNSIYPVTWVILLIDILFMIIAMVLYIGKTNSLEDQIKVLILVSYSISGIIIALITVSLIVSKILSKTNAIREHFTSKTLLFLNLLMYLSVTITFGAIFITVLEDNIIDSEDRTGVAITSAIAFLTNFIFIFKTVKDITNLYSPEQAKTLATASQMSSETAKTTTTTSDHVAKKVKSVPVTVCTPLEDEY